MTDAAQPAPPSSAATRSPLSDGEWHRLHPLTPLFRGGLVFVIIAGIIISNFRDRFIEWFLPVFVPSAPDVEDYPGNPIDYVIEHNLIPLAALAVLAVVLLVIGIFFLSWRFHTFRITGDDVEVRQGVLFRSHRRAPLDRVQGVNLTRPMFARLVGLAKLEVVGAGSDANVKLEYLSTANAEAVRADILRLASGVQLGTGDGPSTGAAGPSTGPSARSGTGGGGGLVASAASAVSDGISGIILGAEDPVEEPQSVVHIPPGRLVASRLLSGSTVMMILLVVAIILGAIYGTPWVLFGMIPALIGFGTYWVRSITRALRYSIAPTRNGVRITFGLFTTVTEILPPGRVHAVEVAQSILWRPYGWWSVKVNRLSGRGAADVQSDQFTSVLPVGDRADVERVLRLLLPGLAEDEWHAVFEHGILGPREGDPYTNTPRRARIVRLLSWRRNGFLVTPGALFLRRGVVWRTLSVFPLARLQSIGLEQGPIDRALGVAGARAHTIMGPVSGSLAAVDRDAALRLFDTVAEHAITAAAADRSHRWAGAAPLPDSGSRSSNEPRDSDSRSLSEPRDSGSRSLSEPRDSGSRSLSEPRDSGSRSLSEPRDADSRSLSEPQARRNAPPPDETRPSG